MRLEGNVQVTASAHDTESENLQLCRPVCGVTPVSTKAIDAAAVLYQAYRPQVVPESWPREAAWPEHGIPRGVLVEAEAVHGPVTGVWGPKVVPETLIVDHGKIYLSAHLTSVCRRTGIWVQPARLRTGRDKGPVERFFRTLREDLLQRLLGYKGPNVHSRGLNPEKDAFFFHLELEAIIREWVAVDYHQWGSTPVRPAPGGEGVHLPRRPARHRPAAEAVEPRPGHFPGRTADGLAALP